MNRPNAVSQQLTQWIVSFVAPDLAFLLLWAAGYALDPQSWRELPNLVLVVFYAPLWPFMPLFPQDNIIAQSLSLLACGMLSHALLGLGIGWLTRKRPVSWNFSVAVALAVVIASVIISNVAVFAASGGIN